LDVSLLRHPIQLFNTKLHTTLRTALWQQPKDQSFYDTQGKTGGLLSIKTYHKISKNNEVYLALSRKSDGWVPGEVSLGGQTSLKLGLSYLLK